MDARGIFSCKQKNTPSWFAQFIGGMSEGDDIPPFFVPKRTQLRRCRTSANPHIREYAPVLQKTCALHLVPFWDKNSEYEPNCCVAELLQILTYERMLNTPLGSVFCVFDGYAQRVEHITDVIRYGPLFLGFSLGPEFEDHLHEPVYKRGVILQGGIL